MVFRQSRLYELSENVIIYSLSAASILRLCYRHCDKYIINNKYGAHGPQHPLVAYICPVQQDSALLPLGFFIGKTVYMSHTATE